MTEKFELLEGVGKMKRESDEDITDVLHPFIVRCRRVRCMFYRPADSDQFTGSCSKPSIVITDAGCMSYNPEDSY